MPGVSDVFRPSQSHIFSGSPAWCCWARIDLGNWIRLLPAAAERLIQTNQIRGCVALAPHQLILRGVERFLRFEHSQEVADTMRVVFPTEGNSLELLAKFGQVPAKLGDLLLQGSNFILQGTDALDLRRATNLV